jgi:hypothetical protein
VQEDIEGQLKKGIFEDTVENLRTMVANFGGLVPYLNMAYDNELRARTTNCNVPTEKHDLIHVRCETTDKRE